MNNNADCQSCFCTSEEFSRNIMEKLSASTATQYSLVSLDYDNFNFINGLFGYSIGDIVLQKMEQHFAQGLSDGEFFTRIYADHFIFWVKSTTPQKLIERFTNLTDTHKFLQGILPPHYHLVCSGGITNVYNDDVSLSDLLDRANFPRKKAKGNHKSLFFFFDTHMDKELSWKKIITLAMMESLKNNEFEMYLQPKILMSSGEIVGAEALACWNSKKYGMIYPDNFIPVFEQNSFIKQLDFFMLEQAALFIKKCIKEGKPPLPISINFSKHHMISPCFAQRVFQTVNKHGVPTNLIEIELTESVFTHDYQTLINIAGELKYLGFKLALDDFGKAYSSLNNLKNLPLDIIKIDKEFLSSSTDSHKGRIIISKVIEMIKSLNLVCVMEGVETKEQAEFLKELGCDLGQGYFYSKPMTIYEYEKFLQFSSKISNPHSIFSDTSSNDKEFTTELARDFLMDSRELYTLCKNIDMGLMKGYLDKTKTVQYINNKALEYLGYSRQEFRDIFGNSIISFIYPDDIHIVKENLEKLLSDANPLKFQSRAIRKDGKVITFHVCASIVIDTQDRPVGIFAFHDITQELENTAALNQSLTNKISELEQLVESQRKSREALRLSEERYRLIVDQSDDIMYEWDFETDKINFSDKFENLFGKKPIDKSVTNNPFILNLVYPEDHEEFKQWLANTYKVKGFSQAEFRILSSAGFYVWIRSRSTAICNELGKPIKAIGVFTNISKEKSEINSLVIKAQLDPLTRLYNKEETKKQIVSTIRSNPHKLCAFFIVDIDNFKGINDNLGHQFGDTVLQEVAQKVKKVFRDSDIIGRLGGDEIVIFMRNASSENIIRHKADMVVQILRNTYFGANTTHSISASVGVALFPAHGKSFSDLYHMADTALYQSKRKGKDCFTVYNPNCKAYF